MYKGCIHIPFLKYKETEMLVNRRILIQELESNKDKYKLIDINVVFELNR